MASQVTSDTGPRVELSSVQEDREESPPPRFFLEEATPRGRDAQHSLEHWLGAGQVSPPLKPLILHSELPTPYPTPEALNRSTSHRCFCAGVPHS